MNFSSIFNHSVARLVSAIGRRKNRTRKTETGESQRATNLFWRNTRLEKHRPDDPLSTNVPDPVISPTPRRGCTCEFCGCQLAPSGEVLRMGDAAKKYRRHDETVENKDKEIARLGTELTEVKRERDALKAGSGEGSVTSHHRPGSRINS